MAIMVTQKSMRHHEMNEKKSISYINLEIIFMFSARYFCNMSKICQNMSKYFAICQNTPQYVKTSWKYRKI